MESALLPVGVRNAKVGLSHTHGGDQWSLFFPQTIILSQGLEKKKISSKKLTS